MEDQLIKEIRAIKDKLASKYDYDLRAIYKDIAQKQKLSNRRIVNLFKNKEITRRSTEQQETGAKLKPISAD